MRRQGQWRRRGREGRREVGRERGYLGEILEDSRHVFIAHGLLVVEGEL